MNTVCNTVVPVSPSSVSTGTAPSETPPARQTSTSLEGSPLDAERAKARLSKGRVSRLQSRWKEGLLAKGQAKLSIASERSASSRHVERRESTPVSGRHTLPKGGGTEVVGAAVEVEHEQEHAMLRNDDVELLLAKSVMKEVQMRCMRKG